MNVYTIPITPANSPARKYLSRMRKPLPVLSFASSLCSALLSLAILSCRFSVLMVLAYLAHTSSRLSHPASITIRSGSCAVGTLWLTFTLAWPCLAV